MFGLPIAPIMTLIPLIGALFIALTDKKNVLGIKSVAFWTSLFALCFSLFVACVFDYSQSVQEELYLFSKSPIKYRVGLDTFSVLFVPIICFVCFVCMLWITKRKSHKKKTYFMALLLFETFSIGSFYSSDIFLMFVLIESTTIPIYILMVQRKEESTDAIVHFLMYTMLSATLILVSFVIIYLETGTSNLVEIYRTGVKSKMAFWLLILGVSIKMPIWPFYSWLPIAHVKSQTVCSVLLASIVLKFSSLLIVRIIDPLFMDILKDNIPVILMMVMTSIAFATAQLIFQDDLKTVFAYFSIIHLNSAVLILISNFRIAGFIFVIMYHSILMPIVFFVANIIKRVYGTRSISALKHTVTQFRSINKPILFVFLLLISVPCSWGFIAEIITIQSISKLSVICALVLAALTLVSSGYAMYIYNSCFGYMKNRDLVEVSDFYITDGYKKLALSLLFFVAILIGIFPQLILGRF